MKSKPFFTRTEADEIISLIEEKLISTTAKQKVIRNKIRSLGFWASEHGIGNGYTSNDFLRVVKIVPDGKLLNKNRIDVSVGGFEDLFDATYNTIIPDYQRPYVWGEAKAEELINDLVEFFITTNDNSNYFLGTVLLYYNDTEKRFEIIDGQQRVTTVLIIWQILNGKIPANRNIKYNSSQSVLYIQEVFQYFKKNIGILERLNEKNFMDRIEFTKIITYSDDDAFVFFDSQNNRGVKLSATDFLKAYHLRAIKSEQLQESCALNWEGIGQKESRKLFTDFFFEKIVWRARNWKGQLTEFETKDTILDTFQKQTLTTEKDNGYPLYSSKNNVGYREVIRNEDGIHQFVSIESYSESPLSFPLSIRQPLHRGLNFFDYTSKYTKTYEVLFEDISTQNQSILQMRKCYETIYTNDMAVYLRHFMQLCLIVFYDSFGPKDIDKAINYLDYLFGSIRLEKQQIKKEAVTRYLKDVHSNLLDIITTAYFPEDVYDFITKQKNLNDQYIKDLSAIGEGVQGRYIQRVLKYFGCCDNNMNSINNRLEWLQ